MTWVFVPFALSALVDWWAVHRGRRRVEVVAKPLTLVLLIIIAFGAAPADVRSWLLVALALSLAGDVFLLGDSDGRFVAGLASFLVGHVAYVLAFLADGVERRWIIGLVVTLVALATLGRRISAATRDTPLRIPVATYMAVISVMVVAAFGTGRWLAAAGAVLFYASDAAIAWTRFIANHRHGRLFVIVTYHVGQATIVGAYL